MAPAASLSGTPADEKAHSIQVGLFGLEAIVHVTNPLTDLIKQAGRLQRRHAGFHGKFIPLYLYKISIAKPGGKRVTLFFLERCIRTRRMYRPGFAVHIALKFIRDIYLFLIPQ